MPVTLTYHDVNRARAGLPPAHFAADGEDQAAAPAAAVAAKLKADLPQVQIALAARRKALAAQEAGASVKTVAKPGTASVAGEDVPRRLDVARSADIAAEEAARARKDSRRTLQKPHTKGLGDSDA